MPEKSSEPLVQLNRLFAAAYAARRGQPRSRYTAARAKRWLGFVALHLKRYPDTDFGVAILGSRSRAYAATHGLARGVFVGFLVPTILMLATFVLFTLGGETSPAAQDFAPANEQIRYHWLDGPLGPVYWAVSWILLFWRNTVWSWTTDHDFLGTDWDWILAILCLVLTARVVLLPLTAKQVRAQRTMQALQPRLKALQEKHKGDRETLQRELMQLYRQEKANPLAGCLPALVQIPVFFGLFHIITRLNPFVTEAEAARFGWNVADFRDAATARFFGVPIVETFGAGGNLRVLVTVGVLVVVWMAISYLNSFQPLVRRGGWSPDPTQRTMQRLIMYGLPAIQPVTGLVVPAGAVIYMLAQSCFSLRQQQWLDRKYPLPRIAVTAAEPPSATFGLTSLLSFGAVAMLTYPLMAVALSGRPQGILIVAGLGLTVALLFGLREWTATETGGLGPIGARRFLNDACRRGLLNRAGHGRYRFKETQLFEQLAFAYAGLVTRYRRERRITSDSLVKAAGGYAIGTLLGPDEWSMNAAEHLEEFAYRKD